MVYYRYNGWIYLYRAGYGNLASSNTGKNLSTWRHVKIVVSGSNIKVYVDGNLEIDYNDGTYTSGYFGFNVFGVSARHENFTINSHPSENEVYYVRDVNGAVLAEYDGAGNLLTEYVYGNGQRLAKLNPNTTVDYYLNDHLGSARAMYGSGWSANYYPFGEVASQTGSDEDTHFDFTGQERDHGTGLMYFGARFYDAEIGRWLAVDPLASTYPTLSPYVYTANNPIILIDTDGKKIIKFTVNLDKATATLYSTTNPTRTVPVAVGSERTPFLSSPGTTFYVRGTAWGPVSSLWAHSQTSWQEDNRNPFGPAMIILEDESGKKSSEHLHGTNGPLDGGIVYIGGVSSNRRKFTHGCIRFTNEEIVAIMNEGVEQKAPVNFVGEQSQR